MSDSGKRYTGGCLCGAIRYTITTPITELRACHCVHCQRASGSHGTVALWIRGEDTAREAEALVHNLGLEVARA